MSVRRLLGRARNAALSAVSRRNFSLGDAGPIVSFTFDDFPRSALTVGGKILKDHGVRGTYYAAMGLMGQTNQLGEQFTRGDLDDLLADGHELGSHTYGHLSGRSTPFQQFEADVLKGRTEVERVTDVREPQAFSYPYGHATWRAKAKVGALFSSCRGICPGVNSRPADLNLLRANNIYSGTFQLGQVRRLLEQAMRERGWVIFYTHDISASPSEFGCTPAQFEGLLQLVVQNGAQIHTVGQVAAEFSRGGANSESRLLSSACK